MQNMLLPATMRKPTLFLPHYSTASSQNRYGKRYELKILLIFWDALGLVFARASADDPPV